MIANWIYRWTDDDQTMVLYSRWTQKQRHRQTMASSKKSPPTTMIALRRHRLHRIHRAPPNKINCSIMKNAFETSNVRICYPHQYCCRHDHDTPTLHQMNWMKCYKQPYRLDTFYLVPCAMHRSNRAYFASIWIGIIRAIAPFAQYYSVVAGSPIRTRCEIICESSIRYNGRKWRRCVRRADLLAGHPISNDRPIENAFAWSFLFAAHILLPAGQSLFVLRTYFVGQNSSIL